MKTDELNDIIALLLDTRDMCGSEREALRDWQADNRKLSTEERGAVWNRYHDHLEIVQLMAGVVAPLSESERQSAYRDIESGN